MKIKLAHKYEDIISVENILCAWQEFLKGKRNKPDVQEFSLRLMDNIFNLHYGLSNLTYKHGKYQQSKIHDPKPRIIHKASVRDRLLHHAVYRILYPFFDKKFIPDSYSCRNNKGTHKAINRFRQFVSIVFKNNTKQCWILKCDIKKFFASVDQRILLRILLKYVRLSRDNLNSDTRIINLLKEIIFSFRAGGLPLGNLTSQLFANIYLNEFDQFIKHKLNVKCYIRYADDFVILHQDKNYLKNLIPEIQRFLQDRMKLTLHPDKIHIKTICSGVDFLGWVNFPDHRVLRNKTKNRMFKRLNKNTSPETISSYLGLLKHGNTEKIAKQALSDG